jgi:hypothetical protein
MVMHEICESYTFDLGPGGSHPALDAGCALDEPIPKSEKVFARRSGYGAHPFPDGIGTRCGPAFFTAHCFANALWPRDSSFPTGR